MYSLSPPNSPIKETVVYPHFMEEKMKHRHVKITYKTSGRRGRIWALIYSSVDKESACNAGDPTSYSWFRKIRWRRDRLPTPGFLGFSCVSAGKESACNAGDLGSIPGLGRSPGQGYPLQYSGLENSVDCIVHGVAKSRTRLSDFHFHFQIPAVAVFLPLFQYTDIHPIFKHPCSKTTADGDYSHESQRHLLLGRKAMTNLDSILISRNITLPTKVYIVKPMVFFSCHVQMWEMDHEEGWVLKNWCFWTVGLEKTLESPMDSKEIKPVNPKGNQPWMFIGRTDAEAEAPILWLTYAKNWLIGEDPDAGKDWWQVDVSLRGSSNHGIFFPGESTGVGCHFLLQGIFPTQGSNPGLPHCMQTVYRLSLQGSQHIVILCIIFQYIILSCRPIFSTYPTHAHLCHKE